MLKTFLCQESTFIVILEAFSLLKSKMQQLLLLRLAKLGINKTKLLALSIVRYHRYRVICSAKIL